MFTIQGGPAKVKPTYIFAGNVWYSNVQIKFNGFLANVIMFDTLSGFSL